jgi:hypothetical protein
MAKKAVRHEAELAQLDQALASIYTPGAPIENPRLFSGRDELLADLRGDLPVAGVHLVLYGERAVGKTSLWQVLLHDRRVQQHSASASDDFVSIFLRVLEELGEQFTADERTRLAEVSSSLGKEGIASVGSKLGEEATEKPIEERRLDLNFVLDRVAGRAKSLDAVVIDEFQNVSKKAVQTQIIEVVKGFADRGVNVKIVLVGVADTGDELIPAAEYAQYKGRHFIARRVPRMSAREIRDIVNLREEHFHAHFEDHVKDAIVRISSGYPATAHRLALRSAQAWARRAYRRRITDLLATTAGLALSILTPALGVPLGVTWSVRSAGVDVEEQDLHLAIEKFLQAFRDHHPTVVERYEEAEDSDRADAVNLVLATLSASTTTRVTLEQLASGAGLGHRELEELLKGEARGLVEPSDGGYRLAVRDMLTFIEASRYLALVGTAV